MSLTLYRPIRLSTMLDRLYNAELARSRDFSPMGLPIDVVADENGYVIHAVVPGVKAEDLSVEVKDNTITLKGETKAPETARGEALLDEICYGKFARSIALDADLDGSKAEALVENGLLTLRIPKAESAKVQVIKVAAR
jgi:HSP20 family protein